MKIWDAITGNLIDFYGRVRDRSDPHLAPKCFVLSLHRSGTRSITHLLEGWGLRTVHYPSRHNGVRLEPKIDGRETDLAHVANVIAPVIHKNDAMTDVPIPTLYRELDARYPNARFLLLRRRPTDWIRSVRRHVGERAFHRYERVQYWHYFSERPRALRELADRDLRRMCERHFSQVQDYFEPQGRQKFAAFDLEDEQVGGKVGAFLGHDMNARLPHVKDELKQKTRWPVL